MLDPNLMIEKDHTAVELIIDSLIEVFQDIPKELFSEESWKYAIEIAQGISQLEMKSLPDMM